MDAQDNQSNQETEALGDENQQTDQQNLTSLFDIINDLRSDIQKLKADKNRSSSTISRAPVRHTPLPQNFSQIETSPVRDQNNNQPQNEDEELNFDFEENDDASAINPHARDTDGYESFSEQELAGEEQGGDVLSAAQPTIVDYSKISCAYSDDETGQPIVDDLAQIVLKSWNKRKNFESMKKLFDKFKSPENCTLDPPRVNPELWKLLNSTQRKGDVKFSTIQKSLAKGMNGVLQIFEMINSNQQNINTQTLAQIVTDIAAILGHASFEISLKRRSFIRNVINNEYKDLCSNIQPITTLLFGDDLPKVIKEVNLTNKLQKKSSRKVIFERQTHNMRYRPYPQRHSFLGQGRGNLPNRQQFYKQHQQQKTKKKSQ